ICDPLTPAALRTSSMLVPATPCRAISSASVLTIRSLVARPLGVSCRTSTSAMASAYCRVGLLTQLAATGFHLRIRGRPGAVVLWDVRPIIGRRPGVHGRDSRDPPHRGGRQSRGGGSDRYRSRTRHPDN